MQAPKCTTGFYIIASVPVLSIVWKKSLNVNKLVAVDGGLDTAKAGTDTADHRLAARSGGGHVWWDLHSSPVTGHCGNVSMAGCLLTFQAVRQRGSVVTPGTRNADGSCVFGASQELFATKQSPDLENKQVYLSSKLERCL